MLRALAFLVVATLLFAASAEAVPPSLVTVTATSRHATAAFTAPKADSVTIYFASSTDRATDGQFLSENIKHTDFFTDSEIQTGQWLDEDRLDPATYYVMLRASPDFDLCYIPGSGGQYDASCANGFSNIVTLVVPKPATKYTATVQVLRFIGIVYLGIKATPLGEGRAYRACYTTKTRKVRCLNGTLDGYSWDASASDTLRVSSRTMATNATMSWFVGGQLVARKRARVR